MRPLGDADPRRHGRALPALPRNLNSLQAGRGVAAILVVLFHNSLSIFALPKYWNTKPFGALFDFGDSGVFFFFVLSGFIILHAHYDDLGRPQRVLTYAWKRFRRIYPIYWVVLLLCLPAYFFSGFGKGFETRTDIILSSFLLIHLGSPEAVMIVSWTLFHEVVFYALFSIAIWRKKIGLSVVIVWLALSVASMAPGRHSMAIGFYFSSLHLLFGMGMAAAWWVRANSVPAPAVVALAGLAVFLLSGADQVHWHALANDWRALCYGLGAAAMILGLVDLERRESLRVPNGARLLGDASYSIYLVHFFLLSLLAKLAWASGLARVLPSAVSYILLACLAVLGGVLCHLRIERPLLKLFGRKRAQVPVTP